MYITTEVNGGKGKRKERERAGSPPFILGTKVFQKT
jgi:hypothetical protein